MALEAAHKVVGLNAIGAEIARAVLAEGDGGVVALARLARPLLLVDRLRFQLVHSHVVQQQLVHEAHVVTHVAILQKESVASLHIPNKAIIV